MNVIKTLKSVGDVICEERTAVLLEKMVACKRRSGKFLRKNQIKSLTNLVTFTTNEGSNTTSNDWKVGRRVVEIKFLAENLKCTECSEQLHLKDIQKGTVNGLGSILHIICLHCQHISNVCTGKRHYSSNDTKTGHERCFDVNTK